MRLFLLIFFFAPISLVWAGCTLSDISIKSTKAKFVNPCKNTTGTHLKGVAVLTNRCSESIGLQVKITGYDKAGNPVATRDLWQASISNILPGDYTFSLDHWLDYDSDITKFDLVSISKKNGSE
jgi:hypothetical protein